jgi:hypothetical protein
MVEAKTKKGKQIFISQLGAVIARNNAMMALTRAKNLASHFLIKKKFKK